MPAPAYTVQTRIRKPVTEVFRQLVDPDCLARYFVERTSGPLAAGQTVVWHWEEWGDYPVRVLRVVADSLIELELDSTVWKKTTGPGYPVLVKIRVEPLDEESTLLSISETGWLTDAPGLKGSHDNCQGWTHMSMCCKAWLEHAIDLR
jgi:uncharacterized protein YndB with AHSA1/START domain